MEDQPQSKISLPQGVLMALAVGTLDAVGYVSLLTGTGDIFITDIAAGGIDFVLLMQGISPMRMLVAQGVELLPYVGELLPLYSLGFFVTWYADAHPESAVAKALETASAATGKGAKGVVSKTESKTNQAFQDRLEKHEQMAQSKRVHHGFIPQGGEFSESSPSQKNPPDNVIQFPSKEEVEPDYYKQKELEKAA